MKKIILIISMLMLLVPVISAVQIDMIPSETEVDKGDNFVVEIILDTQGEEITTWAINTLTYDNADITSIEVNDTWKADGFWDAGQIDNSKHKVKDIGAFISTPVNGECDLCTITFHSTNKGNCKVEIVKGYFRNKNDDNFDITDYVTINIKGSGGGGNGGGGSSPPPPPKNKKPVAEFTLPKGKKINETIVFNGLDSYDTDGDIVKYEWNINNSIVIGPQIDKKFSKAGTYSVSLTVEDDDGDTNTLTKNLVIEKGEDYVPNQDNDTNDTNDTEPPNGNDEPPQNNTQNNTNQTDIKDNDDNVITSEPLLIMLAIAVIIVIILYIRYRREE